MTIGSSTGAERSEEETTRLIQFLFVRHLLIITLRDVMTWLFIELAMTTRSIKSRR